MISMLADHEAIVYDHFNLIMDRKYPNFSFIEDTIFDSYWYNSLCVFICNHVLNVWYEEQGYML